MSSHQYNAEHDDKHPEKSLGDYVAEAFVPVCTAGLVMSFAFFLIDLRAVYYGSSDLPKLRWVYFWFVMAAVCVNRIGVRHGSSLYALPYALGLGGAMIFFLSIRGVGGSLPVNIAIMVLIWWASNRLTKECTLSDDDEDSSGEGLLSGMISELKRKKETDVPSRSGPSGDKPASASEGTAEGSDKKRAIDPKDDWFARQILSLFSRSESDSSATNGDTANREKKHASRAGRRSGKHPGISVIYFSIIVLTAFGLGDGKLASFSGLHAHAFKCMVFYVFFALALLTLTSFSGLRRYLRQRGITMSREIAPLWLILGAIVILLVIGVSYILPRSSPSPQKSSIAPWTQQIAGKKWLETFKSKVPDAETSDKGKRGRSEESRAASGTSSSKGDKRPNGRTTQPGDSKHGGKGPQILDAGKKGGEAKGPKRQGAGAGGADASEDQEQAQKHVMGRNRQSKAKGASATEGGNGRRIPDGNLRAKSDDKSATAARPSNTSQRQQSKSTSDDQIDELIKEQSTQREKAVKTAAVVERIKEKVSKLSSLVSWLIKFVLILALLYIAWRLLKALLILLQSHLNWSAAFLLAVERLRARLAGFLSRFFGFFKPRPRQEPDESQPARMERRPRKVYQNPFTSRKLRAKLTPTELVTYTYEALMARAEEIGCARQQDQTPYEYARNLPSQLTSLKSPIAQLTRLYVRAVYTPYEISQKDMSAVKVFWQSFENQ